MARGPGDFLLVFLVALRNNRRLGLKQKGQGVEVERKTRAGLSEWGATEHGHGQTAVVPWLKVVEEMLVRWGYNGDRAGR